MQIKLYTGPCPCNAGLAVVEDVVVVTLDVVVTVLDVVCCSF